MRRRSCATRSTRPSTSASRSSRSRTTRTLSSQAEKRRLFEFSQQAIERVRLVADVCVGAFFAETKDAAREKERNRRLDVVERWLRFERQASDEGRSEEQRARDARAAADAGAELSELGARARRDLSPFHWWIEFPEVFFEQRADPLEAGAVNGEASFDGVVGNPPFMGGSGVSSRLGDGYRDWLLALHHGAHGNADLSAHFFRRTAGLLGAHGAFGLIATNTIAQGDTRSTGLASLLATGWEVYDATSSTPWPGDASVTVSVVHGAHGVAGGRTERTLDGHSATVINSMLRPTPERQAPAWLAANVASSFIGSKVYGEGFTLTEAERDALIRHDATNAERIFPYLGGEEVNTSPTQGFDRFVISFGALALEQAERWPDLLRIVREKVKPEREKNNREVRRKYWWRFGEAAPALYAAIAPLERCLVTSQVTKHLMFSFQPADRIFSHKLYVFPLDHFTPFAVLQSRVHKPWAWLLSSTMKMDLNYAASDCLETFPFPQPDPRTVISSLETIGETLYEARARFMTETNQGLTKTYNAIKDASVDEPRVVDLRRMHEAIDRAVLDAYGWSDVAVPPYCPASDADRAAVQAFEDEVIDRLYVLNAERAREEERLGLGGKKGKSAGAGEGAEAAKKRGRKAKADGGDGGETKTQGKLF